MTSATMSQEGHVGLSNMLHRLPKAGERPRQADDDNPFDNGEANEVKHLFTNKGDVALAKETLESSGYRVEVHGLLVIAHNDVGK